MKPNRYRKEARRDNRNHWLLAMQCRGHHRYYALLAEERANEIKGEGIVSFKPEQHAGRRACDELAIAWGMAKRAGGHVLWRGVHY